MISQRPHLSDRTPTPATLRFGVIGYGLRGNLAHLAHRPEQGCRVVALADVDEARCARAREQIDPDLDCLSDYRPLLARDDLDAIFILSPDWLHEEHAVAALRAGKAVYLEKPMAITLDGCDRILREAQRSGARLYVGHNMRHFAFTREMKRLIDEGAIGEVQTAWCRHFISYGGDAYYKDWHADRSRSTGLLVQKATHDIDILHWLCGGHSIRVQAMGRLSVYNRVADRLHPGEAYQTWEQNRWSNDNWPPLSANKLNPVIDVEDVSMLHAQLDNGVLVSYTQCHFTPDTHRNYTLIGTEGRIENVPAPDGGQFIRVWNRRCDVPRPEGDYQIPIPPGDGGHDGADVLAVSEFIDYVRGAATPSISPVEARHAVACTYSATLSLRDGGRALDIPAVAAGSTGNGHPRPQGRERARPAPLTASR